MTNFLNALRYALDSSGYSDIYLKVKQIIILEALFLQKDVVAVLPTGYGKSVIFHLLPFLMDYRTQTRGKSIVLVVAPLNSLMDDQLNHLNKKGIKAGILSCSKACVRRQSNGSDSDTSDTNSAEEIQSQIYKHCDQDDFYGSNDDNVRILFTHPETIVSKNLLLHKVYQDRIVACVIDGARLIEEWGHDFRPDYGRLCRIASLFLDVPSIALTATSPKSKTVLLVESLQMKSLVLIRGELDRENIFLHEEKRKPASTGSRSYEDILHPIAEDLREKLIDYPLTIIYLPLK